MRRDDAIRLRHMLDAAREALAFSQGKSRGDLYEDRMLALSLVKSIEIIGEAASQVSPAPRTAPPAFPGQTSSACEIGSFMPTLTLIWTSSGARW